MTQKNNRPTARECIKDLKKAQMLLHKDEPTKVISRDQYREFGEYPESVWKPLFGRFEEFKRQAEIIPTREVEELARHISKHASTDRHRAFNKARKEWGDKYIRNNKSRYRTILGIADVHDIKVDPFWLRVVMDTAKRAQPDTICIAGDLFDLAEFGRFFVDPREWDLVGRLQFVHDKILRPFRELCPDAQIDLIEGNHEYRLIKHLCNNSPAIQVFLSDWHDMDIAKALRLQDFEVNYVAEGDLTAWTKREEQDEIAKNFRIYYNCVVGHHYSAGRKMGYPGFSGHEHVHRVWPNYSPQFGSFEWHQIGCGHRRDTNYTDGLRWSNGFILVHVDTCEKLTNFEYVPVSDMASVGGRFYYRESSEIVLPGRK